jgi:altronate dehydratase large subunit
MNFQGYRRPDGKGGTRNFVLVIPSVGCSQGVAQAIAQGLKGVIYLPNILGCGQMGEDHRLVKKTLVGFGRNPNVFGVLIVGNGCEQLSPTEIADGIVPTGKRVEVIVIQEVGGTRKTIALGKRIVKEMSEDAAKLIREVIPLSELIVGTECGGSDYTSGLASNPAVGAVCDMLVAEGGTVKVALGKKPLIAVVIVAGTVDIAEPLNVTYMFELGAKPVPFTVTVVPFGPFFGAILTEGVTVKVAIATL